MNSKFKKELERIHFLTDYHNFNILKLLLEQSEGISIKEVADKLKISKGMAKGRLQKFTEMYFCLVNIDIPRFESQRITKSYKLMYMLRPHNRTLNRFVDYIEEICSYKIKMVVN